MLKIVLSTVLAVLLLASGHVQAQGALISERVLGKDSAPVTVQEFISLTCSHCAEFYIDVLPVLEKRYVDTGKVKFILRDFPLDGTALKAAALARCMPAEQFYPFISILYKNQPQWALGTDSEKIITQYAQLGGLSNEKAKACLADTKMLDALVAGRTAYVQKYNIQATPTFIINDGQEKLEGSSSVDDFSKMLDKVLAATAKH